MRPRVVLALILSSIVVLLLQAGCKGENSSPLDDQRSHRDSLQQSRDSVLMAWQQRLEIKEQELAQRERVLDSISHAHQPGVIDSTIAGHWGVRMVCSETTCQGSAVGDTKVEQWSIVYRHDTVVISATQKQMTTRVYAGRYDGKQLLATGLGGDSTGTTISMQLHKVGETRMEGQRTILRESGSCAITYALSLDRL